MQTLKRITTHRDFWPAIIMPLLSVALALTLVHAANPPLPRIDPVEGGHLAMCRVTACPLVHEPRLREPR